MRVWFISPYGPIPGEAWRDTRATMLCSTLAEQGHVVTWWAANFSHNFKQYRSAGWETRTVAPGFSICLVPTPRYWKHISFGRLVFEIVFAWKVFRRALRSEAPEAIIASDPPQVVGYAASRLAAHFQVPLVLDVMDLWPELFRVYLPSSLRWTAPFVFYPFYALRRRNLRGADAVTTVGESYSEAMRRVIGGPAPRVVTVFWGVDVSSARQSEATAASPGAPALVLPLKQAGELWAVYAGMLGAQYDIETMLQAVERLSRRGLPIRLIVAGDGPRAQEISSFIAGTRAPIAFVGALRPELLAPLYAACDIGLCPYKRGTTVSMPIKLYDYLACGLPVVSSLGGEVAGFLDRNQVGLSYSAGDVGSLCEVLTRVASDPAMRRRFAANSFRLGLQFDRRTEYGKFCDMLRSFDKRGPTPAGVERAGVCS